MTSARLVLPVPGGPWKIADTSRSASMARRNSFPGASRCSWPMYSSTVRGRIRVASGALMGAAADAALVAAGSAGARKSVWELSICVCHRSAADRSSTAFIEAVMLVH